MKKAWTVAMILVFAFCTPVFASAIDENANSEDYLTKAPAMLVRGATNVVVSPVEVLGHTYKGTIEGKPIVGTLQGFGEGVIWTLDRALRGGWDVVTAFAPRYNGAPPTHELCMFGEKTA